MKKVKYIGKTTVYLTHNKIYDSTESSNPRNIVLRNDKGIYDAFYLHHLSTKEKFIDATDEYNRNQTIEEILS